MSFAGEGAWGGSTVLNLASGTTKRIFANKFSKIRYSNQNGKQRAFPEIFCEVALNRLREHP